MSSRGNEWIFYLFKNINVEVKSVLRIGSAYNNERTSNVNIAQVVIGIKLFKFLLRKFLLLWGVCDREFGSDLTLVDNIVGIS